MTVAGVSLMKNNEIKQKEFRSKKTLAKFLNKKLDSEILRVIEVKNKINYMVELRSFLDQYKYFNK